MPSTNYQPKPEHKFTFGLWTVGNRGRDPFGDATRSSLSPVTIVKELSRLGAYGVNLHDNDLVPINASLAERDRIVREFKQALDDHNMKVPMATTNLFYDPVFKDGAFTSSDSRVRLYALQKTMNAMDLGAELDAKIFVFWGGREGAEVDAAKDPREALKWNRKVAEQGATKINLGGMYRRGQGVPQDFVQCYKWLTVAIGLYPVSGKQSRDNALKNRDYLVSVNDFMNWEKQHGKIPDDAIVLLRTGYGKFYPNAEKYFGTAERSDAAIPKLHFPGLDPEAAQWLVKNRHIKAIGLDTPSIDYGQSKDFRSHQILLGENIPVFENVAHLDQLPTTGSYVIALPMKIQGGSGAPLRIVAWIAK